MRRTGHMVNHMMHHMVQHMMQHMTQVLTLVVKWPHYPLLLSVYLPNAAVNVK